MTDQDMAGESIQLPDESASADDESSQNPSCKGPTHPIFCQDPGQWMNYVHKAVCVSTSDGGSYTGRVYTIDPVSQSVVLAVFSEDHQAVSSVMVIMGHAVEKITELDSEPLSQTGTDCLEGLFKQPQITAPTGINVSEQRDKLRSWLMKNKIPVSVSVDAFGKECLNISDALLIIPPYSAENCQCANEIMLGKVQALIRNMPQSFSG